MKHVTTKKVDGERIRKGVGLLRFEGCHIRIYTMWTKSDCMACKM